MCNVNIATGELIRYQVDLFLPGYIPVELARIYKSGSRATGILGRGWSINLLMILRQDGTDLILLDEDGAETRLELSAGIATFANAEVGITVTRQGEGLVLDRGDGRRYRFPLTADLAGVRRLLAIEDQHANRVSFEYGRNGLPTSLTDTLQRRLQFRFDLLGRLTEIALAAEATDSVEPASRVRYAYDASGDLVVVEDPAGSVRRFEYQDGLLVREIDRVGRSTFWTYDDKRRCVRTWRDGGILYRKLDFDDAAMEVKVTDSLGYSTVFGLNEKGHIAWQIDPLGQTEEKTYDTNGNLLASSGGRTPSRLTLWDRAAKCLTEASSDGSLKKYHFDAHDRLVRTELGEGEEWRQEYDERGNIAHLTGPGGARWSIDYAPEGYVQKMTNSLGHSIYQFRAARDRVRQMADDAGELYRAEYNILGCLIAVTDSLGNTTRCVVDKLGRVTEIQDPEGGVRRCRYDASGRILEIVDEAGASTRYQYGAWDSPLRQIDALGQVLALEYDLEQQLTAIVDQAGHRLAISHDPLGRVTHITGFDGRVVTQSYVPGADVVTRHDGDGTSVRIEGPRHAPSRKTYPDGSQSTYEWSGGILRAAEGPGGAVLREFDSGGRLVREVQDGWALQISIDQRNNLVGVSEDDGRSTRYDYDARRRVIAIRDSHFGEFGFSYDSRDLMIRLDYPNGFVKRLAYDRCDRMILTWLQDPQGRTVLERRFEYDRASRLITEIFTRSDGGPSYTKRYQYDPLGRLTTVLRNGDVDEWYRYDAASNIRACHLFGDSEVDADNRMRRAGSTRFELDARGNRVATRDARGDTLFEYDAESNLRRTIRGDTVTSYRYDPVGRRLEKTHDGHSIRFHWLADTVFKESSENGESHYLFLPTTFFPIAISRNGERAFVCFDQIASPRELLSSDGRIVWSREASEFGVDRMGSGGDDSFECTIRFQGQYRDPESGLDYNYHRYYDALAGQYITPDPLGIDAGFNRYRYVREPLTWIDPYGLLTCFEATVIPRCDWNKEQVQAFQDKVDRYNAEILRRQSLEPPEDGIVISPCARSSKSASEAYKKCNDLNGKKKEGSPDGKGKPTDCKDDIDHIIDKQMGGEDNCDNYVPVNASVNRSLGSQMKRELAKGDVLTFVHAGTKEHCDDTAERTPKCK